MIIAKVQFSPWDKLYNFLSVDNYQVSDWVLVETELGKELGQIISLKLVTNEDLSSLKPILRLANQEDWTKIGDQAKKDSALDVCRELIIKHQLNMKLVDARFSYEGNRLTFAFVADGRVDFRELVKDLTAHFNLSIRLTQIGTRDEAKIDGDCGSCGRGLCCKGFINEFSSITSEMAESQQVVHRGSERISGICGRLMCCLGFEHEGYKELASKLPPIGVTVKVNDQEGEVIGHHVLKQTVDVLVRQGKEGNFVVEVDPTQMKSAGRSRRKR